jgi:hypothetical protein
LQGNARFSIGQSADQGCGSDLEGRHRKCERW